MNDTAVKALVLTLLVLLPPLSCSLLWFVGSNWFRPLVLPPLIIYMYVDSPFIHSSPLLSFSIPLREPVSRFPEDSIYAVSPPRVDRDSRDVFESHVMTGQGQVRALCREDMLMYREYIKNRYM